MAYLPQEIQTLGIALGGAFDRGLDCRDNSVIELLAKARGVFPQYVVVLARVEMCILQVVATTREDDGAAKSHHQTGFEVNSVALPRKVGPSQSGQN